MILLSQKMRTVQMNAGSCAWSPSFGRILSRPLPPHILLFVAGDAAGDFAPHLILLSAALKMNIIASVFCVALAMDPGVGMKQRDGTLVSSSLVCLVNICNIPTVSKAVF